MTAPLTAAELDELERAIEVSTPGQWVTFSGQVAWDDPMACGYDSREYHRGPPYYCTGPRTASSEQATNDADAIAALHNAAPALLAAAREREALDAENARLRVMVPSEAEREALCYAASWPPKEIVAKLVAAADHLLHDHSCDQHGYEGLQIAMAVAKNWLAYGEVEASTTDNDRLRAALQEIADLDPGASLPSQLSQRALDGAR